MAPLSQVVSNRLHRYLAYSSGHIHKPALTTHTRSTKNTARIPTRRQRTSATTAHAKCQARRDIDRSLISLPDRRVHRRTEATWPDAPLSDGPSTRRSTGTVGPDDHLDDERP